MEIRCPDTCGYLSTAREHPAAVVRRQNDRDFGVLLPLLRPLTQIQQELFFLTMALVGRHKPEGFQRLLDRDVADAAGALAQTLETSARGLIYDQQPTTIPAQRLWQELKGFVADLGRKGGSSLEHDIAKALRALETAAMEASRAVPVDGETAFLSLIGRVVRQMAVDAGHGALATSDAPGEASAPPPSLIIP